MEMDLSTDGVLDGTYYYIQNSMRRLQRQNSLARKEFMKYVFIMILKYFDVILETLKIAPIIYRKLPTYLLVNDSLTIVSLVLPT